MNNTGVTMLSILIPTIPSRKEIFQNLVAELDRQCWAMCEAHPMLGLVSLHFEDGEPFLNGGMSIGKKRQSLVKDAVGKYLCFLDDDEDIAPNYVETLVRLCNEGKHICSFRNFTKMDDYWMIVDMGLGFPNEEATPDRMIKRNCWHICPVWSEFAKLYEFDDTNYSEDWTWMSKVLTHCQTEAHTDAILHVYNHSRKHSEADKITQHALAKQ